MRDVRRLDFRLGRAARRWNAARLWNVAALVALTGVSLVVAGGCQSDSPAPAPAPLPVSQEPDCSSAVLTGTSWVPDVVGASPANHDDTDASGGVKVTKTVYSGTGRLRGLYDSYNAASEVVTISNITMDEDLLANGSITLVAEATTKPSISTTGTGYHVYPVLVSLHDGTRELINVTGCDGSGFFSGCDSNGVCTMRATCGPKAPTAFIGANDGERQDLWAQRQSILTANSISVNRFPTCDWSSGTPACPFLTDTAGANSALFNDGFGVNNGKLRTGTYTAKYVLLTNFYNLAANYQGGMKLTVVRKRDGNSGPSAPAVKGALDLNVLIVGTTNIRDSRTSKGKQNLNALFQHVHSHFAQGSTGIRLGKITVYEWTCENSGDAYANPSASAVGTLFKVGSGLVDPASEGKALNVFLVSTIPYSGGGTILGISGGITGASVNGTTMSGLAFSTFNKLDNFNPSCSGTGVCGLASQEPAFVDMGSTIAHEMGHFLGLNHPSERDGSVHDSLPDTPTCTTVDTNGYLSRSRCKSEAPCATDWVTACGGATYCPAVDQCQFNHIMWYTDKSYVNGNLGDGNIFSTTSGSVVNYSSYVQ